jgi:hypothetical protein
MHEAVLSGAAVPSLIREVKREEDVVGGSPNWNRYGQCSQITLVRSQETTLPFQQLSIRTRLKSPATTK